MRKNIQMPLSFFFDVCDLIDMIQMEELDYNVISLCNSLKTQILAKFDAMNRHDSFTKYKSATPGSLEREALRRVYLDLAGIHKDWTSMSEVSL